MKYIITQFLNILIYKAEIKGYRSSQNMASSARGSSSRESDKFAAELQEVSEKNSKNYKFINVMNVSAFLLARHNVFKYLMK